MSRAEKLLAGADGAVVERIVLEPRRERCLDIPLPFADGQIGAWVEVMAGGRPKLWRHQALALQSIGAGDNVVVSTGTSSGKSLIFMAPIVHEMLSGNGKAIVFYPQKALGGDQLLRFRAAFENAGLDPDLVGEINGNVHPCDRDDILRRSRVLLLTPDVFHAWMMRQVAVPVVRAFLRDLKYVVLDEAHVFEGVFGSNAAFLLRRFRSAHATIGGSNLQWIAATATIRDPGEHLSRLTGCDFTVVSEMDNGAPFHGLTLSHIDGPAVGAAGEKMLAQVCSAVLENIGENALIAFVDSRQGVEHVTKYIDRDDVLPYRGGYDPRDRKRIEASLRANELRAVVSTSALELGIDIPQFEVGFNLGIPQTRKALRQRIGRIGRTMPGAFAVIAPATAFAQLGGTFREYFESEVEPSRLYLDNRCIQIQAARCLIEECAGAEGKAQLPKNVEWPEGFDEMFAAALPGAIPPRDLEHVLMMGLDSPHHAYSLRAMRDVEFILRNVRNPNDQLGTIDLEKALREAYPGATYLHLREVYRVIGWRMKRHEHSILLEPVKARALTQPLMSSMATVSTDSDSLIQDRLLQGSSGLLAEVPVRVTDSVEGYRSGQATLLYGALFKENREMARKRREFTTAGVLLRIQEPWFAGDSQNAIQTRHAVAQALAAVLASEYDIAPSDIRIAASGVAVSTPSRPLPVDDAIVVFDSMVGGLRLTSPLFSHFGDIIDRLSRASVMANGDAILPAGTVEKLKTWYSSLSFAKGLVPTSLSGEPGEALVYAPGSLVGVRVRGHLTERRLIGPKILANGDDDLLMYGYECPGDGSAWVAHGQVEPIGHDWRQSFWNPQTNEFREIAA